MTALQLERLVTERCTRCGAPATETNLCDEHQADLRKRVAKSKNRTRAELRAQGLCVDCRQPSKTYRCACCAASAPTVLAVVTATR